MGDPVVVMALFESEDAARDAARHAVEEKYLAARAQVLARAWAVWRQQHGSDTDAGERWTVLFETSTPRDEALRNSLFDRGVALTDIVAIDVRSLDHRYASWVDGGLFHERDLK
jgi:uncharacterized protein involved in tolerance to divalent cations